jgi:ATP-binding cassette subfamily C protein
VIIIYFLIFKKTIINLGYINVKLNKKLIQNILESLSASKLIRLFYKQKFFTDKLEINLKNYLNNNLHVSIFSLVPRVWVEVFAILGICFALFSLDNADYDKNFIITYIGLISFALIRIIPSVLRISNSYQALKYTSASIDKIEQDLALVSSFKPEIQNNLFKNKLTLKDVSLRFEKSKEILLKKVNLEIKKNEIIQIKGKSGSGKTSLVNIISGIYKPSSGIYELDGKIIKNSEISPVKNLGYVTQDTFLFDDKIKNNIAIGKYDNDIDVDRVKSLIKMVELEKFIHNLNNGIDSKIGERGAKISGGQAQRLSIARALYANPDILILDEATNALDKINEEKIFQIIMKLKGDLTVIVISHNPILNLDFDKIYELNDGNLELIK